MSNAQVPQDALVLVGDGKKALLLRNKGTAHDVSFVVEQCLEQDNPPSREQGEDRPGRSATVTGQRRSAVEEPIGMPWASSGSSRRSLTLCIGSLTQVSSAN